MIFCGATVREGPWPVGPHFYVGLSGKLIANQQPLYSHTTVLFAEYTAPYLTSRRLGIQRKVWTLSWESSARLPYS